MEAEVILMSIMIIWSVLMNLSVMIVLFACWRKLNVTNLVILSLTVSDFIQSTFGYPYMIALYFDVTIPENGVLCQASAVIVTCTALSSITHLIALSIEQAISIVKPLVSDRWFKQKVQSLNFIIPCWLYGFAWSICPILGWGHYSEGEHQCSMDLVDRGANVLSFNICLIIFCYILPICSIINCNFKILVALKKIHARARSSNGAHSYMAMHIYETVKKKTVLVVVMIIVFMTAWTPYALVVVKGIFGVPTTKRFLKTAAILGKSSTCYNPIIYAIVYKDFRNKTYKVASRILYKIRYLRKVTTLEEIQKTTSEHRSQPAIKVDTF